jgi:uncharacterized membrane protein YfhO
MFIPDLDKISELLYPQSFKSDIGICSVTIIFITLLFISEKTKKEHKIYVFSMLLLVSLPVIWYGLNGFLYDLCRWGFVPACLFSFIGAYYSPSIIRIKKRTAVILILYSALYLVLFPFRLGVIWMLLLVASSIVVSSAKGRKLITRSYRFLKKLKKNKKRYDRIMALVIIVGAVSVILVCTVFVVSPDYNIPAGCIAMFSALLIICTMLCFIKSKKKRTLYVLPVYILLSTGIIIPLFADFNNSSLGLEIRPDGFFQSLSSYQKEQNYFNRFSDITSEAESFIYNSTFESKGKNDELTGVDNSDSDGTDLQTNLSLRYNFASSEIFYSLIDCDFTNFLLRTGMDSSSYQTSVSTFGFNNKEAVYSLLGINYLYSDNETTGIYGTSQTSTHEYPDEKKYIYKNNYALPCGVTYDLFSSPDRFESFNSAELPYAMMNSVYLEDCELPYNNELTYSYECPFRIERSLRGTTKFGIESFDNTITLEGDTEDCFVYLVFSGVSCKTLPQWIVNTMTLNIDNKDEFIYYITNDNGNWNWNLPKSLYALPLGICRENIETISFINFFNYEKLDILTIPEEIYTSGYERICSETLQNVTIDTNTLTGNIAVSKDKVLCVNLIHNDGWKAYIDGIETPVYKANGIFLGMKVPDGTHDIKLVYRTPLLYEGAAITILSLALIAVYTFYRKKHSKGSNNL